jgi:dTDP-4-dehydrorhamnose 3,5-epimerase
LKDRIKEYGLEGVRTFDIKKFPDERGFFSEIMREDWMEFLGEEWVSQANLSMSYPGIIRAWHRHLRGQIDYFVVVKGAMKIVAYDEETKRLAEVIGSEEKLQIVRIPGKYWHGFKVVGDEPAMLVYFVNKLYDYENPDEVRRPWNDSTIVPEVINGRKDDPRCNKPWDWFYPPHK